MKMTNLVFVSTPYASIKCKDEDRNYYAKRIAIEACHQVRLNGYEPLSPVLAFMYIYNELSLISHPLTMLWKLAVIKVVVTTHF